MQQRHKGPRPNRAAMSGKQEGIQRDRQADFRVGGREASSRDFHRVMVSDWTTSSLRARGVGASTTLGSIARTDRKG
jgi:hypothetical protein